MSEFDVEKYMKPERYQGTISINNKMDNAVKVYEELKSLEGHIVKVYVAVDNGGGLFRYKFPGRLKIVEYYPRDDNPEIGRIGMEIENPLLGTTIIDFGVYGKGDNTSVIIQNKYMDERYWIFSNDSYSVQVNDYGE